MLLKRSVLLFLITALIFACREDEDAQPIKFRPSKIEETGYKRELSYNNNGQVVAITSTAAFPDRETITTEQRIAYDAKGDVAKIVVDDDFEYLYTWEGGRIIQTEEIENGVPFQRHVFSYYPNGRVKELLTYRHEIGGVKQVGKTSYTYDPRANLSAVKNFTFDPLAGFQLQSIFEFDGYDNHEDIDGPFDLNTLNPTARFRDHNPARMVTKNKNGLPVSIEDYTYEFNAASAKRETTVTFLHTGATGSYMTHYFFEASR